MADLPTSSIHKRQKHARIKKVLSEGVQFLVDEGKEDPNTTESGRFAGGPIMAEHNARLVAFLFSRGSGPV